MSLRTFQDTLIRLEAFKRIFVFRPKIDFFGFWSKMTKFGGRQSSPFMSLGISAFGIRPLGITFLVQITP